MVSYALQHNVAAFLVARPSLAPVAGTGADQLGASVDRITAGAGQFHMSALVVVPWTTAGGATGGAIVARVQDSADNSAFTNYTQANGVAATFTQTIPAGPNATGVLQGAVDLSNARRYIRIVIDSDPTGGTPTSIVSGLFVFGGDDNLPAV